MIGRIRPPEATQPEEPKGFDDFEMRLGDVMRGERATMGKSLLDVQRELKIKASYIAAIENADPSAIETPGFVAGYVRSYSRYLGLDPEWAWRAFCNEAKFETAHGMSAASSRRAEPREAETERGGDIFANSAINFSPKGETFLSRIEPGAIGSTAVLLALIGLIGYGGYSVLKQVQRVDVVPIEQTPELVATLDPVQSALVAQPEAEADSGVRARDPEGMDRLYRPQALDLPVMVARDGPIAALDPASVGALAPGQLTELRRSAPQVALNGGVDESAVDAAVAAALAVNGAQPPAGPGLAGPQVPRVVENGKSEVTVVAVRTSWVRIRAANGTTLFEREMQPGESYTLPQTEAPATFRTGNAGGVYFSIDGQAYGPAGTNGTIMNVASLAAEDLAQDFTVADLAQDRALCDVMVANAGATDPALLACTD